VSKPEFYRRVLATERRKLQAVNAKLDVAIMEKNLGRVASLGIVAASIARKYEVMLDNLLKPE
jgi:hypothetical protein